MHKQKIQQQFRVSNLLYLLLNVQMLLVALETFFVVLKFYSLFVDLVLMVKKLVMLMFLPNPYNNYHCHEMSLIKNILPLKVLRPIFLPSRSDSTFLKNSFFHVFYHFNFFNSLVMLYCSWSASIGNNFPLDICPKSIIISGY